MKGARGMAKKKRGPRRTMPAGEPVQINRQVIVPSEDDGKLYPARGLPGGSGILPEEERDKPEILLTELGLTVRKQIRADAERLFFFVRLPKVLATKLTDLSKGLAADAGVEAEEVDHATVLYLRSADGAIGEKLAGDVVEAAQKALGGMAPLEATLQGWGYFDGCELDGEKKTALVALLDCPGLAEAHVALKAAMEGLGLPVEKQTHGYVPHATVAYLDSGDRVDNLPTLGAKFSISELELMHTEGYVLKLGGMGKVEKAQPFGTFGGSHHYAKRIVSMIPEHKTYVEPFAGAAAVLYVKEPSEKEVISDIDPDVVFLHRFIKGMTSEKVEELRRRFQWKVSRESFLEANEMKPKDEAARFYKLVFVRTHAYNCRPDHIHPAKSHLGQTTNPEKYLRAAKRLKGVSILQQDYRKTIKQYDAPSSFFFIDPPYPDEWDVNDAIISVDELIESLATIKGRFIAVLNDSDENVAAFKKVGSVFRLDVSEALGTGGSKVASRLFCANYERKKQSKRLELKPDTDVSGMSNKDLLQAHWKLHLMYRETDQRGEFSTEDVTNLHALVVDELFGRGRKHPAPPDEGLDDVSADFERHVEEQPDWTEIPEKRIAKRELAPVNASGVERGDEIELGEVLQHFKDFKIRQPYVYLVGGLANRGKTKGDIDILVKDTEELPEAFKHVIHFRLGRMLPPELAERLEIHYDNFFGPFTNNVPLFDLTFERINPENEVKEMRDVSADVEKRLAKPFRSPGGKDVWAEWIISNIPEHDVYVEPYAGGASVFFAKEPSEKEVLADVNRDIIDTFTFLKTGSDTDFEWVRTQKWKWSKEQFRKMSESKPGSLREKAYRFKYLNLFSQRGRGRKIDDSETCKGFTGRVFLSNLEKFRERLKGVTLLCKDALVVMREQDGKDVFFYLDPPWKPESANEEWKNFDADTFQETCKGLKGKVLISYQGELDLAEENGGGRSWMSFSKTMAQGGFAKDSEQQIYANYGPIKKQAPRAASAERIAEAERAKSKDELTLGEFFYQPKPTRAAVVEELMTVDSLLRLYREHAEEWLPAHIQKKFDGANHQIHKDGDKVVIYSEDGDDNTDRLPGLVAEIKALKADKLVLPAEIERWKGRQHLPREAAAGYINAKTPADDGEMVANVYDVLYHGEDGDVHKWPTHRRLELLGKLGAKQSTMGVPDLKHRINAAPSTKAHDLEELERAVRRIRELPGSEGIVAKQADAPYRLAAVTLDDWVKLHNTSVVHGIVIGRTKTKGGVWVYHYGVLPGRRDPVETVEVEGRKVAPVGDTFGTKLDLDAGDGILVEAETVNVVRGPKGERMTVWVPRPIKLWPGKPDTVDSAAARARRNLILQVKEVDEEGEITYLPTRPVEKQADPYMEIPPEEKAPYRYTVQAHFRGRSLHHDLRIAFRPGKLLIGWTLLTGIKDAVKKPVVTLAAARALGRTRMDEISKIDWTTGEWAKRPKRGAKEPVRISVQATRKAPEPAAWLDVEGKTKDPVEGKPPPVGGTRHFPGVFQIVDRGDIEFGATKPWLHEYFPSGRALNYRLFFRQLKLKADGTEEELPDNLKGEILEKIILPPSEEAELPGPIWLCIRPDDQTPYVLDIDSVKKDWMPPLGVSALPKAIRKQVPAEYRYWEQRTNAKAKQARDALHAAIKAKEIEIDFEAPYKRKTEKVSMLDAKFVLQEQTWRGPVQIRVGPSKTLWHLRLDVGRPELIAIEMYLNPLDNDELAVRVIDDPHKESMEFEGDVKPSHYLNPTKATPSRIEILDSGDASVLALSDKFLKVQVKGKTFKGLFVAERKDGDWLWSPSEAAPKTKSEGEWQISYEVPILKVDEAKREITGIVLEPEERDAQGEIIDEEVIAKAAHRFLARFNRETEMGLMHKMFGEIGVELYESWTSKVKMELGGENIKKGSWLMTVHVLSDSVWKKVQSGEIAGFSIGGTAAMV